MTKDKKLDGMKHEELQKSLEISSSTATRQLERDMAVGQITMHNLVGKDLPLNTS